MKDTKKSISVKSKRLCISLLSDEEMAEVIEKESDGHLKNAYTGMLAVCKSDPINRQWNAFWTIKLKKEGTPVGTIAFMGKPEKATVEIGFGIFENFRREGYACEALKAMSDWAFTQNELYFVCGKADCENIGSKKVFEKNKFVAIQEQDGIVTYEIEKPKSAMMVLFMSVGMCLGVSLGTATDKIAIGMSVGMCLGLAIGSAMDTADNKKRKKYKAEKGMIDDAAGTDN